MKAGFPSRWKKSPYRFFLTPDFNFAVLVADEFGLLSENKKLGGVVGGLYVGVFVFHFGVSPFPSELIVSRFAARKLWFK